MWYLTVFRLVKIIQKKEDQNSYKILHSTTNWWWSKYQCLTPTPHLHPSTDSPPPLWHFCTSEGGSESDPGCYPASELWSFQKCFIKKFISNLFLKNSTNPDQMLRRFQNKSACLFFSPSLMTRGSIIYSSWPESPSLMPGLRQHYL